MKIIIVIPLYTDALSKKEHISIKQCFSVLASYDIVFVVPQSLEIMGLLRMYPKVKVECFKDERFSSIQAYNSLMLSTSFYSRFSNYDYMLICQTDAYVFKNELELWVSKQYDYIGAPWVVKAKYDKPYYRLFLKLKGLFSSKTSRANKLLLIANRSGNGGFSLRKISSHIAALEKYADIAKQYCKLSSTSSIYNEDVFFSTQIPEFKIPNYKEAAHFSIDDAAPRAIKLIAPKLPFGCHAWNKSYYVEFWKKYIY